MLPLPSKSTLISLLFFLSRQPSLASSQQCTVCPDRKPVSKPDHDLGDVVPGGLKCGNLDSLASSLPEDSALCTSSRATSTLCGCEIPEGGCFLCPDGERVLNKDKELDIPASDFVFGAPEGQFLTCESLEAVLFQKSEESEICWLYQTNKAAECGCKGSIPTNSTSTPDLPWPDDNSTVSDTPSSFSSCTVCIDGGKILDPDREIDLESQGIPVKKCGDLQAFAALLEDDGELCAGLHMISTYCGCEYIGNRDFTFCPDGSPVSTPYRRLDYTLDNLPEYFQPFVSVFNCGLFEAVVQNYNSSIFGIPDGIFGFAAQFKSGYCGCEHDWRPKVIAWCYRVSGLLSFLGSIFILRNIYKSKDKAKNTYHQALIGVSVFDICSSLMYILGTIPTPIDAGFYEAAGNKITCKIQGFFIQLGTTSALFNALLAIYFYLVVCKNWREWKFQKIRKYVFGSVTLLGFGMAFGAIPFYNPELSICYIVTPPSLSTFIPISVFNTLPIALSLFILTGGCLVLGIFVRQQQKKNEKWNPKTRFKSPGGRKQSYKGKGQKDVFHKVFVQSAWYMSSFLVTMPIMLIRNYSQQTFETGEAFMTWMVVVAIFGPLQGFLNALVFFNRNSGFGSILSKCKRKPKEQDSQPDQKAPSEKRLGALTDKTDGLEASKKPTSQSFELIVEDSPSDNTAEEGGLSMLQSAEEGGVSMPQSDKEYQNEGRKNTSTVNIRAAAEEFLTMMDDGGKRSVQEILKEPTMRRAVSDEPKAGQLKEPTMRRAVSDEPKAGQLGINCNRTNELASTRFKSINFAGEILSRVSVLVQPIKRASRNKNTQDASKARLSI